MLCRSVDGVLLLDYGLATAVSSTSVRATGAYGPSSFHLARTVRGAGSLIEADVLNVNESVCPRHWSVWAWEHELGRYRAYGLGSISFYGDACQAVKSDEFIAIDRDKPAKILAEPNRANVGPASVIRPAGCRPTEVRCAILPWYPSSAAMHYGSCIYLDVRPKII